MDPRQFADPAAAYRGVTLWMLNDRLEPAEIERQLRGFRHAGLGAVITRTFDGLGTEYLSEEWMAILQRIVAVAGEIGVGVWFQAGYMPNGIPELPEHLEAKALVARRRAEPPEPGDSTVAERGETVYAERRLHHVLDLLSPEAGRSYVRQAYERTYGKRFADDLGRTVQAVWVDEPSFLPPLLPWSDRLAALYRRRWGEEIAPHVPALFARAGDFQRVRHRYWRTVVEMFLEGYFAEVSAWCGGHGLKFTGHLMGEETLFSQIAWTGSAMPAYGHMHIPGVDHLTRSMTWTHGATWDFSGPPFLITPKQCSSVASQTGRKAALAEMYGVSSQGLTFRDRKRIGDFLAVAGINFRCLHGSFYSLRGRRKRIYPPHLSAQQPWWPDNRIVADYFARLSYALRQGTFQADVLVIHPIESAYCVFDPLEYEFSRPDRVPDEIAALNASLAALSENLMKIHRGFEYGDEGLLARMGSVAAGRLGVGEMTYRAVILPSVVSLRESTVELLCRWLDSGGPVLSVGEMPTRIDGAEDERIEELNRRIRKVANEPGALAAALAQAVPPAVEVHGLDGPCEDVWLHERC
ncbi:MAG: glycosyl hydrolase, partial [Phycisphaerae bacterium]